MIISHDSDNSKEYLYRSFLEVFVSQNENTSTTIVWGESVSIENADEKKQELLDALENYSEIYLDVTNLDDMDVSCIQLVVAAHKESKIRNKQFKLTGNISDNLCSFLKKIGIPIDKVTSTENFNTEILETISAGDNNA